MKTENKPNGYELSRKWFAFCFENPAKVNPNHSALYFWLIELNNRRGWASEFAAPSDFCMAAVGMKSYNTYSKTLRELVEFGFVRVVKPSLNQHCACIIALSNFDGAQYEALDRALTMQRMEHASEQRRSNEQSKEDIDKQVNSKPLNPKQINNTEPPADVISNGIDNGSSKIVAKEIPSKFKEFRILYPGTKRGVQTEFENLKKQHKDWLTVLPLLKPSVDAQIAWRASRMGKFVPEWKNLTTWINQRCWENEMSTDESKNVITQEQTLSPPSINR